MDNKKRIRSAHMGTVNSVFVNFEATVVIAVDDDSIRIWDPVSGNELYHSGTESTDDFVIPGVGLIY